MPTTIEKVIEDLDFATNRIGEQVRAISIGVLAVAWLFLAGGTNAPAVKVAPDVQVLLLSGALAIGSLLADYFQYLCAYFESSHVLVAAEQNPKSKPTYDYQSFSFRARKLFFWLKQAACLFGTGVLVYAIVRALLGA